MGGDVVLRITKWSDGTYTAENPQTFNNRVIAKDKSLSRLLTRLATKKYRDMMRTHEEIWS